MPYDKDAAMQLLVDKYGYQKYPQKHFESRFTRFYESPTGWLRSLDMIQERFNIQV